MERSAVPKNKNSLYQQHLQAAAMNLFASSQYPSNLHPHHPSINPFGQHRQLPAYNQGNMQVPYQTSPGHPHLPTESSGLFGAYGAGISASPFKSGTFFEGYGAGLSLLPVDSASPMSLICLEEKRFRSLLQRLSFCLRLLQLSPNLLPGFPSNTLVATDTKNLLTCFTAPIRIEWHEIY